ncbi:macro domain-containing protein [Sphingobacterium multivorum]|uniref:macro domain-containing protein n=1 Tax=Sphingobacterium multivorum TaxID=28454 RepID=UPI0028ADA2CC|nr:macro domain-containing protein [Sphingobacterium multivorum]
MVTYLDSGNIFNLPDVKNYAHGCNCAGAMGKGIALQFKEKYNQMYLEYKKRCKDGDFSLGMFFLTTMVKALFSILALKRPGKPRQSLKQLKILFSKCFYMPAKMALKK